MPPEDLSHLHIRMRASPLCRGKASRMAVKRQDKTSARNRPCGRAGTASASGPGPPPQRRSMTSVHLDVISPSGSRSPLPSVVLMQFWIPMQCAVTPFVWLFLDLCCPRALPATLDGNPVVDPQNLHPLLSFAGSSAYPISPRFNITRGVSNRWRNVNVVGAGACLLVFVVVVLGLGLLCVMVW